MDVARIVRACERSVNGGCRLLRFNALTAMTSIAGSVLVTSLLVETLRCPDRVANIISVVVARRPQLRWSRQARVSSRPRWRWCSGSSRRAHTRRKRRSSRPKTAAGFAKYAAAVEARRDKAIASNEPFLDFERHSAAEQARIMATLRRGEVYRGTRRGGARPPLERNSRRRRADQSLARHGVRAERQARCTAQGAAGAAERQAQAGRCALVARRVARRRFTEGVPAAAADQVRDGGLRHRVRRRLPAARRRTAR